MSTGDESVILGEFRRVFDDRYRIALPAEMVDFLGAATAPAVLVKEQDGCLSVWRPETWNQHYERFMKNLSNKVREDLFESRQIPEVQRLSRLISTRSKHVQLGGRGRLLVPEGFREFLAVEPNQEVMLIGAGVCLEIWRPTAWQAYLKSDLETFNTLFRQMAG